MRLYNFLTEDSNKTELDAEHIHYAYTTLMAACKSYITSSDFNSNAPLYRGTHLPIDNKLYILKHGITQLWTRKNRQPQGTSIEFFDIVNDWLVKNKFCDRKNSVFCSANKYHAQSFSDNNKLYVFLPVGNYKYTYVKGKDFNLINTRDKWHPTALMWTLRNEFIKNGINVIEDIFSAECKEAIQWETLKKDKKSLDIVIKWLEQNPNTIIEIIDLFGGWHTTEKPYKEWMELEKKLKSTISNTNIQHAAKNGWEVWFNCESYFLVSKEVFDQITLDYNWK